jgi:hypothetical protein
MDESVVVNKALKAAKKSLKKQDDNSMKLKALAKLIAEQLSSDDENDSVNPKKVKKWIISSDKFAVDGKKVSLSSSKKRKDAESSNATPSKKARKGNETTAASSSNADLSSIETWRTSNKIVVKHAKDDEEGAGLSKEIQQDSIYFPFTSFDDCKSCIAAPLIRQCTDVNGFQKPSPIQAQAWPILMHKKRDVVGIAETGSGKTLGE